MGKTRDDEEYEKGVRDGQRSGFFDDVIQANFKSYSREGKIYDEGYKYGATHRYGSEGRYHTWDGKGSNDPKSEKIRESVKITREESRDSANSGGGGSSSYNESDSYSSSGGRSISISDFSVGWLVFFVFLALIIVVVIPRIETGVIKRIYPAYETSSEKVIRQKQEARPMQERWEQFVSNSNKWLETPKSPQSLPGRIIFISSENGNGNIFLADPNSGKRPVNLTKHFSGNIVAAAPSLDGKQIAFIANQKGESGIYVMNSDGTKIIPITTTVDGLNYTELAWRSPYTILTIRQNHPYVKTIWEVEISRSGGRTPPAMMIPSYQEYNSKWIVASSKRRFYSCTSLAVSNNRELAYVTEEYYTSPLGSGASKTDSQLIVKTRNKPMSKSFGLATVRLGPQSWSPSGDKIVFHFSHTQNLIGILELRKPGSGKYHRSPKIHWLDIIGKNPAWSLAPDGKGKAIDSDKNSTAWSSGRKQVNLTVPGKNPAWSPDGNWIAFDNEGTIYAVEVASGNVRKIVGPKLFGKSGTNPFWVQFEKTEKMEKAKQEAKEVRL